MDSGQPATQRREKRSQDGSHSDSVGKGSGAALPEDKRVGPRSQATGLAASGSRAAVTCHSG